jgi:hypothetical protein
MKQTAFPDSTAALIRSLPTLYAMAQALGMPLEEIFKGF